jgi:hypothetical protein
MRLSISSIIHAAMSRIPESIAATDAEEKSSPKKLGHSRHRTITSTISTTKAKCAGA